MTTTAEAVDFKQITGTSAIPMSSISKKEVPSEMIQSTPSSGVISPPTYSSTEYYYVSDPTKTLTFGDFQYS